MKNIYPLGLAALLTGCGAQQATAPTVPGEISPPPRSQLEERCEWSIQNPYASLQTIVEFPQEPRKYPVEAEIQFDNRTLHIDQGYYPITFVIKGEREFIFLGNKNRYAPGEISPLVIYQVCLDRKWSTYQIDLMTEIDVIGRKRGLCGSTCWWGGRPPQEIIDEAVRTSPKLREDLAVEQKAKEYAERVLVTSIQ